MQICTCDNISTKQLLTLKTLYPHILFYFRPYEDNRGVYDVREALII